MRVGDHPYARMLGTVLVVDPPSGTFLFSQPWCDSRRSSECLLTQLWAPIDYFSTGWPELWWPDPERFTPKAVVTAWSVDAEGNEQEADFDDLHVSQEVLGEGFSPPTKEGYNLIVLEEFPDRVPLPIQSAVAQREAVRSNGYRKTAEALNESRGRAVCLRLLSGEIIGGNRLDVFSDYVKLERSRALYPTTGYHPSAMTEQRHIAAVLSFRRKRLPRDFGWRNWKEETDPLCIRPQLWGAICPSCRQAVRPPWRLEPCYECRKGNVRDKFWQESDEDLEANLRILGERRNLELIVRRRPKGDWSARFKTAEGEVARGWLGNRLSERAGSRREALVALSRLVDDADFDEYEDYDQGLLCADRRRMDGR